MTKKTKHPVEQWMDKIGLGSSYVRVDPEALLEDIQTRGVDAVLRDLLKSSTAKKPPGLN
jgi:hypothetical protein